jgi:hypothetical protein
MTTNSDQIKAAQMTCGEIFTKDDGSEGTCTLLQGHPSGHTDIPAPPGGDE